MFLKQLLSAALVFSMIIQPGGIAFAGVNPQDGYGNTADSRAGTVNPVYGRLMTEAKVTDSGAIHRFGGTGEGSNIASVTDPVSLFYEGYDNSSNYRIPSLLTTKKGTVIAAVDQRRSGSGDSGDIATVIRRSRDGGRTWGEPQQLIDLPAGGSYHSFTIDSSMLQDEKTGRVFLLVDMFPESTGLMSGSPVKMAASGYREINGKTYLVLMSRDGNKTYTLRENGRVYLEENGTSSPSPYSVPSSAKGELYKDGAPAGNIFLYTGDQAGELSVIKTSYLWLISSDDEGRTWSEPVCLNGQVKKDFMVFLGTGPGVGIQIRRGIHKGRLVFPVYYTNSNGLAESQSSAVIYSDDNGVTWKIGESPNDGRDGIRTETMNDKSKILTESQVVEVGSQGRLKLFCRNQSGHVMVATSDDAGTTWRDEVVPDEGLYDCYCQLSIVAYPKQIDNKPAYVFSNPAADKRNNGVVRIGLYDEAADSFDWKYSQLIWEGKYQYSCISVLPDGTIGILYEGDQPNMRFARMTPEWIVSHNEPASVKGEWIKSETGWWFKMAGGTYPADEWAYINGSWYHFDTQGYMQTGWYQDKDSKWYYLTANGGMAKNTTIDGKHYVGSDGAWLKL